MRVLQRDAPHDREAIGITLGCFEGVVVAVARRHDYDAIYAGLINQRRELLDRERLRHLRLHAEDPPILFRLPQMHLSIDDGAFSGLGSRFLRR
ncbi:MAG: hypothetical protein WA645_16655 [Pseudolabrys sp.]